MYIYVNKSRTYSVDSLVLNAYCTVDSDLFWGSGKSTVNTTVYTVQCCEIWLNNLYRNYTICFSLF